MAIFIKQMLFWLAFAASLILLFAPVSVGGGDEFDLDKAVHALAFFVLILTARFAYPNKKFLIGVILVAYAFTSEFIQGKYLPLRHFDWYDLGADIIGLLLGTIVSLVWFKKKPDEKKESLAE